MMTTHDERAAIREEILDRLSRTEESVRREAITELASEYGYRESYIAMLARSDGLRVPRRRLAEGAKRPRDTTLAVESAFAIVGEYLNSGATYSSVAAKFGIGRQKVIATVQLARTQGVIGG